MKFVRYCWKQRMRELIFWTIKLNTQYYPFSKCDDMVGGTFVQGMQTIYEKCFLVLVQHMFDDG